MMMATVYDNNSDDSEEEIESNDDDIYRRKYQLLLERCEVLQQDNERLVHRAQQVKRLLRRGRRDRKLLMERLDKHGDNWRNVPITFELEEMLGFRPAKGSQHGTSRSHFNNSAAGATKNTGSAEKPGRKSNSVGGVGAKRKASKSDPNAPSAPKRRATASLQFNQDLRPLAHGNNSQTGCGNSVDDIPKQELARQLSGKWSTFPQEDKKPYYERHEKSKEKLKLFNSRAQTPSDDNPS